MPKISVMFHPRLVLITGATRRLGRAMAEKFVELGHTVVGCGRSRVNIKNLQHRAGKPHDFSVVDVASDSQVRSWMERLLSSHGAAIMRMFEKKGFESKVMMVIFTFQRSTLSSPRLEWGHAT